MAWYYVANGASQGPVTEPELRQLREQNVVALDTPIWTEGMAEWTPFQSSSLAVVGTSGQSAVTHTCAECSRLFPEEEMLSYENSWVCATCKPLFFQRIKEGVAPKGVLIYAGVGRRFVAILIDGLILLFLVFLPVMLAITFLSARNASNPDGPGVWFMPVILILEYGLPAAFEIFFIGKFGATPGKMLMKLKVVDSDGGPISFGRATGRYFGKMLSAIILYVGFLMAFWDEEKRALHDRICKTRVISTQG